MADLDVRRHRRCHEQRERPPTQKRNDTSWEGGETWIKMPSRASQPWLWVSKAGRRGLGFFARCGGSACGVIFGARNPLFCSSRWRAACSRYLWTGHRAETRGTCPSPHRPPIQTTHSPESPHTLSTDHFRALCGQWLNISGISLVITTFMILFRSGMVTKKWYGSFPFVSALAAL
jgi:hypothetical protein